jgi:hypothetical protein
MSRFKIKQKCDCGSPVHQAFDVIEEFFLKHVGAGHRVHQCVQEHGYGFVLVCGTCDPVTADNIDKHLLATPESGTVH